jgi:hypothetical protein
MMTTLILLACTQEQAYQATKIEPPAGLDVTTSVVLLDDGTVAATWREKEMIGAHGEVPFAKPYVWDGKAQVPLPRLKDGWGTVIHGRNGVLVGYVLDEYNERPCMWTPDAKDGWKKPTLKVLDDMHGWASWVDATGKVWISDAEDVSCWDKGKVTRTTIARFDLVGTSRDGKLFGNKFGGFGVGFSRMDQVPGFFESGKWTMFAERGEVLAVNDDGVAVGRLANNAVVWRGGKQTIVSVPGTEFGEALDVRSDGTVVWTAHIGGKAHVFLWRDGKSTEITDRGFEGFTDVALNDKGQILFGGAKLTLLTPSR